jgi:hypothetical protein
MLEVLKFLGIIDEVMAEGVQDMVVQPYKPGSTEKLPLVRPFPKGDPNPAVPYVSTTCTCTCTRTREMSS